MIIECARDMMPFMAIFFVSIIAFSSAFGTIQEIMVLDGKMEDPSYYKTNIQPYMKYWQNSFLISIGYFDSTPLDKYRQGDFFVFILANVANFILLLNLLISIINETFARVYSTYIQTSYKEKVKIMNQMQDGLYGTVKSKPMPNEMLFVAKVKTYISK